MWNSWSSKQSLRSKPIFKGTEFTDHRGPDNNYLFKDCVWLGHTRLAINDLSTTANQPFVDSKSGLIVIFNGEIYNYRHLRYELRHTGPFNTDSEAEVLARMYSCYGEAMPNKLDGMFALLFTIAKDVPFLSA